MNQPLTDLVLDAGIAATLCRDMPDSDLHSALESCCAQGVRLWLYAGEIANTLSRIEAAIKRTEATQIASALSARQRLDQQLPAFQWLAALSGDMECADDPEPLAAALVQAAKRLGDSARILTSVRSRLDRGMPFMDLESVPALTPQVRVDFIDLKAQQDRIRAALESGIHRVLHHGRYVMGDEIGTLESRLAQITEVEHCICVSSGTDALLMALLALEVGPGDEIITSPFSFFATAEVIALLGANPVYVDIDPATFNIDAAKIEVAVTGHTRGILPVNLYGQCAEMDEINAIGQRHSLPVIEDAAQSFGATYRGRASCALSDIACTSFFPAKPLGAYGDGGACFTSDAELAARLRQIRDHGQDRRYHHVRLGVNGRLDTLQATVLLAKLDVFDNEINRRQEAAQRYAEQLSSLEREGKLVLPIVQSHNTSSWAQYTVRVKGRDEVQRALASAGIPTAVHYPVTLYQQPALIQTEANCPEGDRAADEVLSLPMHPYLGDEAQARVSDVLADVLARPMLDST
ncbi:MAG: DegT/DnrJ/EryC1/StrS family aminotransferase [Arenicellales bacterium]|jgi:UDP-2-acetamido-2-deoxy-ribo-hexuluronate aminotransferase|nr:DegT/DnrJ/EryC1/StrS family aminotransferase [Arenicellales bacterium]|tara:strand:+ start:1066 stop:2628 length:1563 start_codon:yes stop_codon:yes gene_type:complete